MKGVDTIEITITSKIQIYPNNEQIEILNKTMFQIKKALNYISKYIFDNNCLSQSKINTDTYYYLRETYSLKSQMAQSCMKSVIAKYQSAKSNGHKFSLINFKKNEYDLVWNRDYSLNFDKQIFSVNSIKGRLKIPFVIKSNEKYFDETWSFGTAKLVNKFNKFFLHIPMTKEINDFSFSDCRRVVGVDLGINFLATTYDSDNKSLFFNGEHIKDKRAQFSKVRKELQQVKTPSSRKRLKAIGSRENRFVTDVNHQVTMALIEKYGSNTLFVLEDLTGVRNSTEKVRKNNRYISVSWAFYQFRQMLEYKANLIGSKVIFVDPKYTSQTCPKCSHVEKSNRDKKNHIFKCKTCDYTSNDDRIGAMNLQRKGIEYISEGLYQ